MHYEHEGMSLWYGTPDTPAPEGAVHAGSDITVTIAVKPADASNRVELLYRRDQGTAETVIAKWLRHDLSHNAQYFKARFPAFRVGDTVEYTAVCSCAGRQVPSRLEVEQLASSFHVVTSETKPIASLTTEEASRPDTSVIPPVDSAPQHVPSSEEPLPHPAPAMPRPDETTKVDTATAAALSAAEPSSRRDSIPGASPVAQGSFFTLRSPAVQPIQDGPSASVGADTSIYTVVGTVASPDHAGVGGLRIQIVDKNVGQDVPLAESVTDGRGGYRIQFSSAALRQRGKEKPDLQARVFAGEIFLAASDIRYNATNLETLNVKLPAHSAVMRSEYETLTGTLAAHYNGRPGDLKESADRQDITYLANKTGWDARAVALAALADQFSQHRADGAGAGGIQPAFYYALFRAGLPANQDTLYSADVQTVSQIWQQAIEQGVIPQALEHELPGAVQAFHRLSAAHALDARALTGTSSLKEMLHLTLGDDAQRQQQFADLYTRYRGDLPTFWDAIQQSFGEQTAKRLQLDGQLGYLTLNNALLISSLRDAEGQNPLSSTLDLAQRGYYRAEKWSPLLGDAIPEQIPGITPDEKRAHYAELLAAQVRLSFPTATVAGMVGSGEIPLDVAPDVQDGVYAFLTEHQGAFEIGMQPVEQYLARNNLGEQVPAPVKEQIKRLHRVLQITPTDQAMTVLLTHNLDSAYEITRYDAAAFVRSFKDEMGGEAIASLTYAKAQLVYSAVLNIASTYLTARRAPTLGSDTNALIINPAPTGQQPASALAPTHASARNPGLPPHPGPPPLPYPGPPPLPSPAIAYPTLERLFGSMDYCACDECRSILSPAAYLVDLLQFIDCPSPQNQNPQTVLLEERRPDIKYLPLTCENTNTALPYIDLVNETLEYFVANKLSLANYTGHDTDGTITSDELLASPQFVSDAAYTTLKNTLFPPPLPFHRPLELLRLLFQKFGVQLQDAMAALRPSDVIERGTAVYGWRDILMEQLGLSRIEYQLLTDSTLTLQQLYGYPTQSDTAVITALSGVQDFSRRVNVSYNDLVSILKTQFVNPNSTLIPRLERLDVPFTTLQELKNGALSDAAFEALLPAGINPAEYGGNIPAWVKDPANYARIMGLITIANQTDSTDLCSMEALQLRYANPDTSANKLHAIDFVRLLRFIRLWRKLGLTIEQTDDVIAALYPAADLPTDTNDATDLQLLDTGFKVLLPRIGFAFQVINHLQLTADRDLPGLLACWAPIGMFGDHSLYRTMFLAPTLLKQDAAFGDDGYGNFLQDNSQKLVTHTEALRAAFSLTDNEFSLIVAALGFDVNTPLTFDNMPGTPQGIKRKQSFDDNPSLTLDNISAIYRRGWMARKLRLSVVEFLLLTQFTGLDPFAAPDPAPTPPAEPSVIRLIQLVQALRAASLKPVQALYLIWNQDISGKSAPSDTEITGLARTLRADFAAVERQFALVDDPNGDIAKALMALVYGTDATDFFFGLLNNTLSVAVPYDNPQPTLPQPVLDAASGRLSYDDLRKRLTYTGVLDTNTLAVLDSAIGANGPLKDAVDKLDAANHEVVDPFFATYLELGPLYTAYVASNDPPQTKRTALLQQVLPDLKQRRKQEQALATVTAAAGTDSSYTPALLDDAAVLHAAADNKLAIINDVTAVEARGLSAQFFLTNNPAAMPDQIIDSVPLLSYVQTATIAGTITINDVLTTTVNGISIPYTVVAADTTSAVLAGHVAAAINAMAPINRVISASTNGSVIAIRGIDPSGANNSFSLACSVSAGATETYTSGSELPAGNGGSPIAGIWSGYLDVPQNGYYNIYVTTDAGATVTLNISGADAGMALQSNSTTVWHNQNSISLTAGALSPIVLTVTTLTHTLSVSWQGQNPGLGMQVIPAASLYSATLIDHLRTAYVRFLKATSLAKALSLTANEIAYLTSNGDFEVNGQGWLNTLSVSGSSDPPTAISLRDILSAVLDFARIKAALSPNDERLLLALENPATNGDSALLTLTRWDQGSLNALLTRFFSSIQVTNLAHLENFRRVYDAYALVTTCGISAAALIATTTNDPTAQIVSTFQSALRSRYAEADWLAVVKPINDTMRGSQRDALVAYVLQQLGDSYAQSLIHQTTSADASTGATLLSCSDTTGVAPGMLVQGTNIAPGTVVSGIAGDAITISTGILAALPKSSNLVFVPENAVEINTPDKLFEYFLMDVEMDPCMQTSRIRHALSSVQLFIERCLRNLEPDVSSSDIPAAQWEWMKRYRVWEANRKVFLWPENWLDPELRNDQSQFFKDTMSELLQSDITEDTAATALLNYLSKLEEVAKLEPCGMYYVEPSSPGTSDDIVHVVARTAGAHRKYYYRRREGCSWTPWEQIKLDIEDNPVIPVVWKGRLLLFWLRILKQTPLDPQAIQTSPDHSTTLAESTFNAIQEDAKANAQNNTMVTVQAVLCWSEYYNGKWQPAKTSDVNRPTEFVKFPPTEPMAFDRTQLQLWGFEEGDALRVYVSILGTPDWTSFLLYNTHSLPVPREQGPIISFPAFQHQRYVVLPNATDTFIIFYTYKAPEWIDMPREVLKEGKEGKDPIPFTTIEPHPVNALQNIWDAPFFFQDSRHVFYVSTREQTVTIPDFDGYGIAMPPSKLVPDIPPLVLKQDLAPIQKMYDQTTAGARPGVVDPALSARFISEDANIRTALGTTAPVRLGNP